MQLNALTISLVAATLINGLLTYFTWKRRPANGSTELFILLIAITQWSFFAIFEAMAKTVFYKVFFSIITYIGITSVPVLFLIFAYRYVNIDRWLTKRNIGLLFILPAATLIIAATNNFHKFLWQEVTLSYTYLAGIYGIYVHGPWFWVHAIYSYILMFIGILILLVTMLRYRHLYLFQSRILIFSSAIPFIANLIYTLTPMTVAGVEITPVFFTFSGILIFFAIFYYKLFNLSPVAWETIIEDLDEGIILFNRQDQVVDVNKSFSSILGIDKVKIGDLKDNLLHKYPQINSFCNKGITNKKKEIQINKNNKKYFIELGCSCLYDKKNKNIIGQMLMVRDITQKKLAEKKLKYISFHDSLTGLYNRAFFEEELKRLDSGRELPISIIMSDLNGLKLVNDAFGHENGDILLKRTAKIIKRCCRSGDIIARWGGDEYIVLLPKTTSAQSLKIIKRIKNECNRTIDLKIPISISIGYAIKNDSAMDINSVLKKAEDRMYRHKLLETKSVQNQIIESLTKTLYEKNIKTEEHSNRLIELSIKLGKRLNLPDDRMDELILHAKLHDIGKVAIDENLLNKDKKLSEKEWREIKKHSEAGYRIANSSTLLSPIAEYILAQNEWWNGKGYPQGLKQDEIPLISRIVAIIDAYDEMINGRSYKKAKSKKEAIKELRKFSGIQFDPMLVSEFIEIIKNS